jgi:hypothetical protein
VRLIDRRVKASHGYRAVHLVVSSEGKLVEIQVRTMFQHTWAELCEKMSDKIDRDIKYGGGPEGLRSSLQTLSDGLLRGELAEAKILIGLGHSHVEAAAESDARPDLKDHLLELAEARAKLEKSLADFVARVAGTSGVDDAISD